MLKTLCEEICCWWWLLLTHTMEGSVRYCILKVSHDEQHEVCVERPECRSKCDDGLFKSIGDCAVYVVFSDVAMEWSR